MDAPKGNVTKTPEIIQTSFPGSAWERTDFEALPRLGPGHEGGPSRAVGPPGRGRRNQFLGLPNDEQDLHGARLLLAAWPKRASVEEGPVASLARTMAKRSSLGEGVGLVFLDGSLGASMIVLSNSLG